MTSRLDSIDLIKLVSVAVLAILTALFSAVEALLHRLNRSEILDIAEAGGPRHDILTAWLRYPQRYSTTLITAKSGLIVSIVVLLLSMFDFNLLQSRILSAVLATLLVVVVTELIPKNYIRGSAENSMIYALRFLQIVYWSLYILIKPLTWISYLGVRVLGGKPQLQQSSSVSPEVLETLVNVGDSQEILEAEEREMISRILDLPDKVAREIMVARTDMTCLDVETPEEEVLKIAIESRHSRLPVYEERIDRIIGILHVKDMLDYWAEGRSLNLRSLIAERTPFFTPETKKIWDLFQDLRANKQHMAIVVDEYGGTAGIITLEDIIEEVVGEIQDEYDYDEQAEWIPIGDGVFSVDARVSLADFNERLGTQIESEDVDTIGGFVVDGLGRVPDSGDHFSYQGLDFTILECDERRVHRIRVGLPESMTGKSASS